MSTSAYIDPEVIHTPKSSDDHNSRLEILENEYASKSLGLFSLASQTRQWLIKNCTSGSFFDSFILVLILLNSLMMAFRDYRFVDANYEPVSDNSVRNYVAEKAEILFTIAFILECLTKILAFGFIEGEKAYLKSPWNVFDFVIVVCRNFESIISVLPIFPNLSVLRSLRVLRPLKSISKLQGLKKIIVALVDSAGDLCNVMFLLTFLIVCFSIMGVLFWNGLLHARCRLTPFPVKMPEDCSSAYDPCWQDFLVAVTKHPEEHRCLPYPNDDPSWTQSSSPWFLSGPQNCIWPIDIDDERVCSLSKFGYHKCSYLYVSLLDKEVNRTCGSNYDRFGNNRFINDMKPYEVSRMDSGTYIEALNFGFTKFDSFMYAFVTTFQIITLEGWTDIMNQIIDAWYFAPAVFIFSVEVILCGYIALNLVLAVITNSLQSIESDSDEMGDNEIVELEINNDVREKASTFQQVVEGKIHNTFMMICIVLNTLVLGLDHYGISEDNANMLEKINVGFTFIFFLDVVFCSIALGPRTFWSNPLLCFDGVIGVISILELIIIFTIPNSNTGSSAFSVFRSLRLFRVFKMAKSWKSLHSLIRTMISSVKEIGNFAILLMLFMFIYSLVGMQILSNRLHFSSESGATIAISDDGYDLAVIPRSHFDSFFWSMVTVFQILTGENWNAIMYDSWRAQGYIGVLYMLSLLVIGVFIVMNLFLAILLKKFEYNGDSIDNVKIEQRIKEKEDKALETKKRTSVIQLLWAKLTKNNCLRKFCFEVVESSYFDVSVTVLIVGSSFCLALDNPLQDPASSRVLVLQYCDLIFTIIFMVEMVIKIFAYGLIAEKGAYLRNSWNVLDFITILISLLNQLNMGSASSLRALRTLRVLRPLRMLQRLPELKVVVDALLLSFPSVADVAVLCTLFFLIFSSFGVNFLKGTFYKCEGAVFDSLSTEQVVYLTTPIQLDKMSDNQKEWFNVPAHGCTFTSWTTTYIPSSKQVCDCLAPGEWKLAIPQNFDNVLNGMALLFEIATTEGWVEIMYAAIDQRGADMQPIRDSNPIWAVFFICFLIFGAFFILELFVGVTIANFKKIKERTGRVIMTEAQKQWAATQTFTMKIKPEKRLSRPTTFARGLCYDFIMPNSNPRFQDFIILSIVATSILAASTSFGDSDGKTNILETCNLVLSIIFTIEMVLKLLALGKHYFDDGWNRFDFTVVCASNVFAILALFISQTEIIGSFVRFLRVCRLFRLVKRFNKLRMLFNTLIVSIPSIVNIGALLVVLFFIYAVIGVQLFSFIPNNEEVNEHANFRSFGSSMFLLLRFSTGENWNGFMRSIIESKPNCVEVPIYNHDAPWCLGDESNGNCTEINGCGAGFIAYMYFYSFTLLVSFVILNLFIGIVIEAFDKSNEGDILSPADMTNFVNCWSGFDPAATWHIKVVDMRRLLIQLGPPLGVKNRDLREVDRIMKDDCLKDLPVNQKGEVNIVHVATYLAKRLTKRRQGKEFHELSDDHPIQKKMALTMSEGDTTLNAVYIERSKKKLRILHAFVKAKINPETLMNKGNK